jgi:hypothetical protein
MPDLPDALPSGTDQPRPAAPPSTADAGWNSIVRQAAGLQAEGDAAAKRLTEGAQERRKIGLQIAADKLPPPPELPPPAPPDLGVPKTDPLESFGSFASMLGIFGAFATKRPAQAALNASAAAMNANRQRNEEEFQRHREIAKAQSDYAAKYTQWQVDRYRALMEQHKGNTEQALTALSIQAAADKDDVAAITLRSGRLDAFEKVLHDRETWAKGLRDSQLQLDRLAEERQHHRATEDIMRNRPAGGVRGGEVAILAELVKRREAELQRPLSSDEYIDLQRQASISYQNAARKDDTTRRGQDMRADTAQATLDLRRELGERALDQKDETIEQSRWWRQGVLDAKNRGLDQRGAEAEMRTKLAEARDANLDEYRKALVEQGWRKIELTDERIKNDRDYKETLTDIKKAGLDQRVAEASALDEYRTKKLLAGDTKTTLKREEFQREAETLVRQIDDLSSFIKTAPVPVAGITGLGEYGLEKIQSAFGANTPESVWANQAQQKATALRFLATKALKGYKPNKYDQAQIDVLIPGVRPGSGESITLSGLKTLRETIAAEMQSAGREVPEAPNVGGPAPPRSSLRDNVERTFDDIMRGQ